MEWADFVKTNGRDLMIIAHEFNQRAMDFELGENGVTPALSPRELSAMTYIAKGFSRAQAAVELQISEHTLRVYIEAAGSAPGRGVIPTLARAEWSLARSSGEVRAGCWAAMDVLR